MFGNNNLHSIKPLLKEWESVQQREHIYEVILCRLRIDHMHLTHSFLLCEKDSPTCAHCGELQTVKPIF